MAAGCHCLFDRSCFDGLSVSRGYAVAAPPGRPSRGLPGVFCLTAYRCVMCWGVAPAVFGLNPGFFGQMTRREECGCALWSTRGQWDRFSAAHVSVIDSICVTSVLRGLSTYIFGTTGYMGGRPVMSRSVFRSLVCAVGESAFILCDL